MAAILEARGLSKSFGAVTAADDINVAHRGGHVVGAHRHQRRRQDDVHQHGHGLPQARPPARIHFAAATSPRCRRARSRALGICRSFQIPQLFGTPDRAREHAGRRSASCCRRGATAFRRRSVAGHGAPRRGSRRRRCSSASASREYRDQHGQRAARRACASCSTSRMAMVGEAAHPAARRADQRRLRRGEVRHHGHGA